MPDPRLFVLGLAVAAIASLLIMRASMALQPDATAGTGRWRRSAWVGLLAGLAAGWDRLGYAIPWPPATGLDRLLLVVLPAVMVVDWIDRSRAYRGGLGGAIESPQRSELASLPVVLLGLMSVGVPLVLLWGSVYLARGLDAQSLSGRGALFVASGVLLGAGGVSLQRLSMRPGGWTVPVSLVLALLTAGTCILLGGYIKGGAVAFPLAGSLLGGLFATIRGRAEPASAAGSDEVRRVLVTLGTISLYGVLLVGCAFGRLPGSRALLVGLAPLLGWITEWAPLRVGTVRWLTCVRGVVMAVPLAMALVSAKHDFDRTLGPLVGWQVDSPRSGRASFRQLSGSDATGHAASIRNRSWPIGTPDTGR